jgi:hypothetical protein
MRRVTFALSVAAVVLVAVVALGRPTASPAQEETPPGGDAIPQGVGIETLAFAPAVDLPPSPAGLGLVRYTVERGSTLPVAAQVEGLTLLYVESGQLTFLLDVAVTVGRAGETGGFANERIAAGTGFTLGPGDSALIPSPSTGEGRNEARTPAVVLAAAITPPMNTPAA